ncbi:transcriptional regulator [Amycolatopsis rhabdoformis]|uniref:Transcriptional regulator n=1 Tax=Amycolatopsis rhabdoformis TaxID=1448059 RepID=A0ABZ1HZF2_9PSEU|nr:transcriptional regulator [Amycolatopsis rhabdoformis]WSE27234.1 transcriptional regulator [Amycolatopsis rhabdoformis]
MIAPAVTGEHSESFGLGEVTLDQLRERVRKLAGGVFDEDVPRLEREMPHLDLGDMRTKVLASVADDADTLLRTTNNQNLQLNHARLALANHVRPPERDRANPRDRAAHAATGFALWLGVLVPVVFWQLLQTPLSGAAHFWISVAVVVAGFASLKLTSLAVASAGRRLNGVLTRGGAAWPIAPCFAAIYLLVLWRLRSAWQEAMGAGWAVVVWILLGLVTLFLVLVGYLAASDPVRDEREWQRVPRAVFGRSLLSVVVASVVLALVLTGALPLPWPEWATWVAADVVASLIAVAGAPALLGFRILVPARYSRDPNRRGSPAWTKQRDDLQKLVDEADEEWLRSIEGPLRRRVRNRLNAVVDPPFGTTLPKVDRAALGQMRAGDRAFTETPAGQRLKSVLAGIRGGAIGMAGPRGAGKSTLLEAYQAGRFNEYNEAHIALLESVPVRYDAREFVLHLFAQTCAAVIGFCAKNGVEAAEQPPARLDRRAWLSRVWPFAAVVVVWAVVGVAGASALSGRPVNVGAWLTAMWWPIVAVLGVGSILGIALRRRSGPVLPRLTAPPREPRPPAPGDLHALRGFAEARLRDAAYQLKHTSGWSGKIGLPLGVEAGASGSQELTSLPRTYPQIVHDFGKFLSTTIGCLKGLPKVASTSVVIILDELDKIASPEAAQDFVNEIKALFSLDVPGFLVLVSVSEDALASFERRGLPVRDAFDSAFDVIFRLEYLKLDDSKDVLYSRILGLPEPFVCLCHSLSGGLPRELIRVARQMIGLTGELADVSRVLVDDELRDKRSALRTVVARGAYDDVSVSDLVRHLDAHAQADPAVLLRAVENPPAAAADLHRLQVETLGHLYFLSTVLEVFGPSFSPAALTRGKTEGDTSFDTLTSARQLFPVNAHLAWLTVSAFRQAWGLRVIEPPERRRAGTSGNGAGEGLAVREVELG